MVLYFTSDYPYIVLFCQRLLNFVLFFLFVLLFSFFFFFFFFQAEDGIRDLYVTGVQTCALPISSVESPLPLAVTDAEGRLVGVIPRVTLLAALGPGPGATGELTLPLNPIDRKSTRLNSSHVEISYAVFCLKKKINTTIYHEFYTI